LLAIQSILAATPKTSQKMCAGFIRSLGNNVIGNPTGCANFLQPTDLTGDPGLGPLTDNGEPGNAHFPLLRNSQAINSGNDAACPEEDQIGRRRRGQCHMGAITFRRNSPVSGAETTTDDED
jgi:hypothetical protein